MIFSTQCFRFKREFWMARKITSRNQEVVKTPMARIFLIRHISVGNGNDRDVVSNTLNWQWTWGVSEVCFYNFTSLSSSNLHTWLHQQRADNLLCVHHMEFFKVYKQWSNVGKIVRFFFLCEMLRKTMLSCLALSWSNQLSGERRPALWTKPVLQGAGLVK